MNYMNYNTVIVEKHHVHLVNWPSRITFGSPSNVSTIDDIRLLRSALQNGDCRWEFLTAQERKEHDHKLADARNKGVVIGKKRKERSDKGRPRMKGKGEQSKKRKMSQLPPGPMYKSADFIDDQDELQPNDDNEFRSSGSGEDN